jgi:hypothetical protein
MIEGVRPAHQVFGDHPNVLRESFDANVQADIEEAPDKANYPHKVHSITVLQILLSYFALIEELPDVSSETETEDDRRPEGFRIPQ